MIDGKTKIVGLIGNPVEHSLSPIIHNAAFKALKLNWCYVPLAVKAEYLEDSIFGLRASGFVGVNITAPHKEKSIKMIDVHSPETRMLGAVNTLSFVDTNKGPEKIKGFNTDVYGFKKALINAKFEFKKENKAVVVGAGGASKAVIIALVNLGFKYITLLNRNIEHGKRTCTKMNRIIDQEDITLNVDKLTDGNIINHSLEASLLVNTTPVGTSPYNDFSIWPDHEKIPKNAFVFDLVYNPTETKLLKQAKIAGCHYINGLEMLIQQAAKSFEIWTKITPPLDIMYKAYLNHNGGL